MGRHKPIAAPDMRGSEHGTFPQGTADYARNKVAEAIPLAHDPVSARAADQTRGPGGGASRGGAGEPRRRRAPVPRGREWSDDREAVDVVEPGTGWNAQHWEARRGVKPSVESHDHQRDTEREDDRVRGGVVRGGEAKDEMPGGPRRVRGVSG
ncbi:hypothetical protein [Actinokineospora xionganensis]|uniref:Uncharacterized protein n=1 Tax=Actinokineospora xionganensis TaxID=2684470 RepID=A0ABR7L0K4_9PSEU|nr:hypothetical protein [Actinokineospora xionganensis]MBC6445926.1 hypothetical protein [Actinokineospora xionganensis]